ncbi:putative adaptor complex protein (AP) 3 delta subunit 1 [Trypanosoma conorhini]|uniref:Structural maintenance of chromosomes protein n=1 Tax=Trypanosoma conorhini TaxID=83891 RepID=A0A422Q0U8_9TRYP|nr:putative adaptor complex protein (AP) 3 delta subunit 1 [Trypanosoma conorhini]RNF23624.1 putative adaptor complex protein (AP) 3 delta subunit 1 [Trypanosoma conorhini]
MHIKNILISGFRSYRDQSFQVDLSPKNNVIVGKNGSGKSNFFAAVQFVLSEKYSTLTTAERKELFHVGSGRPALSIFVEIIFDNSDGRLVIPGRAEEKEVRIRRTLGLKQDEFRVNDRRFTATEVRQLLESAGFSSSNPYYIVEQGKIVNMANMSDEERCQLIKDVAGTRVYESRRKESEEILQETSVKYNKIEESIGELQNRLTELETESAELKSLQGIEKERKCIEYSIFSLELNNAKECLQKLDEKRGEYVSSLNEERSVENNTKNSIEEAETDVRNCSKRIAHLEGELQLLEREATKLNSKKAIAQLDAADAKNAISRNEKESMSLQKEAENLGKNIEKMNRDLEVRRNSLHQHQTTTELKSNEVSSLEAKLEILLAKRGRRKLFKNKAERDAWLAGEIERNRKTIDTHKKEIDRINKSIKEVGDRIEEEDKQRKEKQAVTRKVESKLANHEVLREKLVAMRNTLNMERRSLWQKVNEQEITVQRLQDEWSRSRHQLERAVRHDIRQGLQSLKEVLHELADERLTSAVHGQLIELIDVRQGYETAVEVTAGNALFNVVIDSFEVSAIILGQINLRRKPGRISFFPLDTCKSEPIRLNGKEGSSLLMDNIACDSKFKGVVAELFGKTAIVPSIEEGAKFVKQYNCDAVTMEGDQISRKGGITGGYLESRNLRLLSFNKEKKLAVRLSNEKSLLEKLCHEVAVVEQKITDAMNDVESLRGEAARTENDADADLRDARLHGERKLKLEKYREQLLDTRKSLEKGMADATSSLELLQQETKEEFLSHWGKREESQLEAFITEVEQSREDLSSLQLQGVQLATEVQLLEDTLQNNTRRMNIVTDRVRELGWVNASNQGVTREQGNVDGELSFVSKRLEAVRRSITEATNKKIASEEKLEALKNTRLASARSIQERRDNDEKIQIQRTLLIQRRDDAMDKIRKLGIVPKDASKYSGQSLGMLMHRLKEINEKMKKYSHVNRKAMDQYSSLMETKNELVGQKENLQNELESIHALMGHLDKKKDEAVERTFKQMQYNFEEVFKEIVSTEDCHGELQLVRSSAKKNAGEDPYIAARIRVSFGLGTPTTDLAQLSGGQKSLVALALIFAIQRCDPAPFYLFDEIDAALDAEYRASVAKLILKDSEECQFITATFKTEMLEAADRVLGVFFHNKISRIQAISLEEGVKLLKQAAFEERKRAREVEA